MEYFFEDTYHGPSAFSEVESKSLADLIRRLQRQGKTIASYLSVHAYSQLWMSPYGYKKTQCPGADAMKKNLA